MQHINHQPDPHFLYTYIFISSWNYEISPFLLAKSNRMNISHINTVSHIWEWHRASALVSSLHRHGLACQSFSTRMGHGASRQLSKWAIHCTPSCVWGCQPFTTQFAEQQHISNLHKITKNGQHTAKLSIITLWYTNIAMDKSAFSIATSTIPVHYVKLREAPSIAENHVYSNV